LNYSVLVFVELFNFIKLKIRMCGEIHQISFIG